MQPGVVGLKSNIRFIHMTICIHASKATIATILNIFRSHFRWKTTVGVAQQTREHFSPGTGVAGVPILV